MATFASGRADSAGYMGKVGLNGTVAQGIPFGGSALRIWSGAMAAGFASGAFRDHMRFDKVISIGASCQIAHQVRRLWPQQQEAYPFDWIVTPYKALLKTLGDNFAGFVCGDYLELKTNSEGKITHIENTKSGVQFYHDFPCSVDFISHLVTVKKKYDFLIGRWREMIASGSNVLFIRQECFGDISDLEVDETLDLFKQLGIAGNYYLLFLHRNFGNFGKAEGPNHRRTTFPQPNPWTWEGADSDWDELAANSLFSSVPPHDRAGQRS